MRRFATTFALLTIAFSTAACDPYQAITNALPHGCDPVGPQLAVPEAQATESITSAPDVNIPAPNRETSTQRPTGLARVAATPGWAAVSHTSRHHPSHVGLG